MEEEEEKEEKSKRVNVRILTKQYNRMMAYGEVLGLDSDSAVIKHFINLGLQFGGASLAAQISSDTNKDSLQLQERMLSLLETGMEQQKAEQTDLVEQAANTPSRKRS